MKIEIKDKNKFYLSKEKKINIGKDGYNRTFHIIETKFSDKKLLNLFLNYNNLIRFLNFGD